MTQPISSTSHWSYPANPGSGFVWFGEYKATEEDLEALNEVLGYEATPQESSLCGRYHPEWTSDWYEGVAPDLRPGGAGSPPYKAQWCGEGVKFTTDRIWHIHKGKMIKDVPPNCGAYHTINDGEGTVHYSGPEPGSEAAKILNKRAYHWDDECGWYYPGPDAPKPWWD